MGGNTDEGTSMLETPPYVIALVLFFFLIITLGFEKILHLLRTWLQKQGRQGLIAAMTSMQSELMCLGLATLILLLFQNNITSYCLNAKLYTKTWLDHVAGCSCCLSRTKGVSPCYLAAKGCKSDSVLKECCSPKYDEGRVTKTKVCSEVLGPPDWDVPNTKGVYSVNVLTGKISNETIDRHSLMEVFAMRSLLGSDASGAALQDVTVECDGRIQTGWEECGYRNNFRPAIGPKALHQIHIFIFITAIVHISLGILLILVASLRVHLWRKWRDHEDPTMKMVQLAVDEHCQHVNSMAMVGKMESQLVSEEEDDVKQTIAPNVSRRGSLHPTHLPRTFEIERRRQWTGRPEKLRGFVPHMKELAVCLGRQFMPNVVTKEEFSIMRSAFVVTHHIQSSTNFSFLDYLMTAMEEDFSHVVGLGLPMWCFIIIFVLLSSAIGWCIWVFVIISGGLLAIVNTKLVWIARYVARGGHVHKLKPGIFWLNRPWLLLPVIKFLLFFVSYVYANAIFFATQFGSSSCFFSRAGFQGQPVPWWAIMLVNTIFMASLSLLTLPLYSITVQMGGDFKAHLLPEAVVNNAIRVQSIQVSDSKGFRRLISAVLPRERDSGKSSHDEGTSSLVKNAAPIQKGK